MPIIACNIPAFPIALLARADPDVLAQPLALLNAEDRVLAATRPARIAGVQFGQTARQAQVSCPDLALHPIDFPQARQEFDAVLSFLDDYSDTVEPTSLGRAYLDAPDLGAETAIPFCQDLGRSLRQTFGISLQPAIGCDRSKFTANAAARHTTPGRVRVVLGEAEIPFLRPLPVQMLPLPVDDLHLLHHLGIDTLGQFAALPAGAVFQQFGPSGRLAQQWAMGRDNRPLTPRHKPHVFTRTSEFDPPLVTSPPLLAVTDRLLSQMLTPLRNKLQAVQTLRTVRQFSSGPDVVDAWHLSSPTTDHKHLMHLLSHRWDAMPWDAPVVGLSITLGDVGEAPGDQLLLFPGEGAPTDLLSEFVAQLQLRYGAGRLLRAEVGDALRLRVEQRVRWQAFAP